MNLYISDTHFGHRNVIGFDKRPFAGIGEMDHTLIWLWNDRVDPDDDVWILGDLCYKSDRSPDWYLKQLKGHKHLVIGNHDKITVESEQAAKYLESVEKMTHLTDTYQNENVQVLLCHFPMAEWNGMKHGSYHIYGHIHNRKDEAYEFMKTRERALNAGCMIHNYAPASMRELIVNNKRFQEETG